MGVMVVSQLVLAIAASSLITLVLLHVILRVSKKAPMLPPGTEDLTAFLFDGEDLLDATQNGRRLLARSGGETDWQALRTLLQKRFPDLGDALPVPGQGGVHLSPEDDDDPARLHIEAYGNKLRVELCENAGQSGVTYAELRDALYQAEFLQEICNSAPFPMWKTNKKGSVVWHNTAYHRVAVAAGVDPADFSAPILTVEETISGKRRARAAISRRDRDTPSWYDVSARSTPKGEIFHATNIDAVIQAELAQSNFVQTLAKTFAQLSTGLAVFDRNGQLALFNPALLDMTRAPADFLSSRPSLLTFFDRLRECRTMPEPKRYAEWRKQITQIISDATDGRYQETWELDSGKVYRVTGRPHPDGAVAFLFEDITAEVSQTRSFRHELNLGQSILDNFDAGLVVFSQTGELTLSNKAFREMWGIEPETAFAATSVIDCLHAWQRACTPNPALGDLRDFVLKSGERAPWDCVIQRLDGSPVRLYVAPIVGACTMVRFDALGAAESFHCTQGDAQMRLPRLAAPGG